MQVRFLPLSFTELPSVHAWRSVKIVLSVSLFLCLSLFFLSSKGMDSFQPFAFLLMQTRSLSYHFNVPVTQRRNALLFKFDFPLFFFLLFNLRWKMCRYSVLISSVFLQRLFYFLSLFSFFLLCLLSRCLSSFFLCFLISLDGQKRSHSAYLTGEGERTSDTVL